MFLTLYVVRRLEREEGDVVYWSNEIGWCDIKSATRFTKDETNDFDMPVGCRWDEVYLMGSFLLHSF